MSEHSWGTPFRLGVLYCTHIHKCVKPSCFARAMEGERVFRAFGGQEAAARTTGKERRDDGDLSRVGSL